MSDIDTRIDEYLASLTTDDDKDQTTSSYLLVMPTREEWACVEEGFFDILLNLYKNGTLVAKPLKVLVGKCWCQNVHYKRPDRQIGVFVHLDSKPFT